MLQSIKNILSVKAFTFILIFVCVLALLGVGFILGLKNNGFPYITSTKNYAESEISISTGKTAIHSDLDFSEMIRIESFQLLFLFGLVISVLFCWTLILLTKSRKDKNAIARANKKLQKEINMRENATRELNETNQKLSNATGQLDGIIQGSTDLITAVDKKYRYISFNESYRQTMKDLFDVDVEIGMSVNEAIKHHPTELKDSINLWERALKGESFTGNQVIANSLDRPIFYELSYSPLNNKDGEIIGASQICRDVTERNITEEKIKQERDFASAVFDVNKSLILVLDREGRIIRFNKACEELSGYEENEVKGRIIWNILIPSEDISNMKLQHRNFDCDKMVTESINQWITKDEITRIISWQVSAIKDEDGTNEFLVATGIDITETRESEIAQRRMLEILENSTDFISISDLQGQMIYLNPAGRKLLGLTEKTNIKPLKTTSCHPKWADDLLQAEAYPTAFKNGTWIGETAIKTLHNEEIPTSQLIMAHKNDYNDLEYFSTVIRDTSYRNKITEELEAAKEAAIETSKKSSNFLAQMSHEIRTPMNGVVGLAELLLNSDLNEVQKDYVESIQKSGDALINIINDILDFSKLESGKLKFENIDFDLYETIESTFEIFAKTITQKNLELSLHIEQNVPSALHGDPGRLRQVLLNFISNAVKFTDEGEIVVNVKVEEDGNSPILHFSITDSGIGISAGALRKLFKPFIQADTSIMNRFGGTGLGLAISKQIVTLMNGEIGAKSTEGKGSTFWFTAKFESRSNKYQRVFAHKSLFNVKTLIVDDNDRQRNILLTLTKSWGMLPDESSSSENALNILKIAAENGEAFEVLLIDLEIQSIDGNSFIQKIKNEPILRKTKIILMTPFNGYKDIDKFADLEINDFITKPIQQTKLFELLIKTLSDENEVNFETNDINPLAIPPENFVDSDSILKNKGASTMLTNITKNTRILIAEDNLVNQKVILNQVSGLGFEVELVENGEEALDALRLKDYSLILMDCQMPIMDGFTATKKIRASEQSTLKHIPIIAVTAHAIEGDRERCLAVGMDDYISKPTKQQVLFNAINFWLHKSTQDIIASKKPIAPKMPPPPIPKHSERQNISARLFELEETCGKETVLDCINLFLVDTENLLKDLAQGIDKVDFETIFDDAHKLKGSSSNMGATRLPKFAQKLTILAKDQNKTSIALILKQIFDEYEFIRLIYLEKKEKYENSIKELEVHI